MSLATRRPPPPCVLLVDANLLLDAPELERWRVDHPAVTVVVLERVERELRGLGRRPGAEGQAARRALIALEGLRQRGRGLVAGRGRPAFRFQRGSDSSPAVDAHLVAEAAAIARRQPDAAVAVATRDHGVWALATRAGVCCVLVHGRFDGAALQRLVREALAARL